MINYNKVLSNLEELKLDKIRTFLPNYLNSIKDKDISIVDILYELTEKEVEFKNQRASRIQVVVSAFPFEKEVRDFDFLYHPLVNKSQILDLESLRFLENKENIVFVGTSGVRKTHLAAAILDRLLHHSHIIKITGPSYRLKGKIEEFKEKISSIK